MTTKSEASRCHLNLLRRSHHGTNQKVPVLTFSKKTAWLIPSSPYRDL